MSKKTQQGSKLLIIGLIILVLLLLAGGAYLYLKESAVNSFNDQLGKLDEKRLEMTKKQIEITQAISQVKKLEVEGEPDYDQVKKVVEGVNSSGREYLARNEEYVSLVSKQGSIIEQVNSQWLNKKQKEVLSSLEEITSEERDCYQASFENIRGDYYYTKAFLLLAEDLVHLHSSGASPEGMGPEPIPLSEISYLEKYTKESFSFDKEEYFKESYPENYNSLYQVADFLANFYNINKAAANNNMDKAKNLQSKLREGEEEVSSFLQAPPKEIEKDEENLIQQVDAASKYRDLVKRYQEEEIYKGWLTGENSLSGENRELARIAYLGLDYLRIGSDDREYFSESSFDKLMNKLSQAGVTADDVNYNSDDFSYEHLSNDSFSLKYNDEVAGELEYRIE